jgi:uncharacterized protein with von Willebrand factor type A (vWA) domain
MAKKEKVTEIICVIDKSGSMDCVKDDVIGGFNNFIDEQKKLKDIANLTLTLFDTNYEIINKSKDIKTIDKLDNKTYCPGGCTALLDAVGKSIDEVSKGIELDKKGKVKQKILMVIATDGQENSSKEYKKQQIVDKIKEKKEQGWEFVFLGANETAFSEANNIGMSGCFTQGYATGTSIGTQSLYRDMSNITSCYRSTGKIDKDIK